MNLNLWNYLVIGTKAVFGGVPSVVCYLANLLNEKVLSKCNVDELIKWAKAMVALSDFCDKIIDLFMSPETLKREATVAVSAAIRSLGDKLMDGQITAEEIKEAIEDINNAVRACKQAFKKSKNVLLPDATLAGMLSVSDK